ncbi:MAG: RsmB/NOP family class I SAM-dependent RNA methyltransferase [Gammaproteobacteria bacterium]|nr:RsmB/NOP family class I SAM-dependent RNA methyltransferase [Gammaproteobacteria bacterium]MDH5803055.1 RsmB/NOP family class I SAM-dependent RNA methyltransferase [Gammaproteobacteria bacterium]
MSPNSSIPSVDATRHPLPEAFVARLQHIVPENRFEPILQSFSYTRPLQLRINTLRAQRDTVLAALNAANVPSQTLAWQTDALLVATEFREAVLRSELYQEGLIYSQSLSSQLAPLILNPQPGEEVLDLCAAPGGKTLHMACLMKDQGRIGAVEKVKTRYYKLKTNIQHQGAQCIQTYLTDGTQTWRKTPERFHRALLDAPCSSESRFNVHNPASFSHWHIKKIKEATRKQKALIYSAIQCLKPGGTLLYSTCSFAPEENEAIVHHALKKFGDAVTVQPIELPQGFPLENVQAGLPAWQGKSFNPQVRESVRVLPDGVMHGFYLCLLRKQ